MEAQVMTSKMQERKAEAAEFLIDTRGLPPELRYEIRGMVRAIGIMREAAAKAEQLKAISTAGQSPPCRKGAYTWLNLYR